MLSSNRLIRIYSNQKAGGLAFVLNILGDKIDAFSRYDHLPRRCADYGDFC